MTRVALLGTGAMGSRLAQNLLQAQHEVIVYNRTKNKLKPFSTAQNNGANMPISIALREVYQQAIAQGYGTDNITGVIQLFT